MTTKTPPKSCILEAVYETASDLKRLEDLRCEIAAGLASGPGIPAGEVFDRLERKYAAIRSDTASVQNWLRVCARARLGAA